MSTVIEMAPFQSITGAGSFGVFLDNDGTTCWLIGTAGGPSASPFARCNLSDGSSIHTGVLPSPNLSPNIEKTPIWMQDDAGHYYFIVVENFYKARVIGSGGNLGDGYMTADTSVGSDLGAGGPLYIASCYGKSGGVRYGILMKQAGGDRHPIVGAVNLDTMTVVGTYAAHASVPPNEGQCFMDSSGVFWFVLQGAAGSIDLVSWNPSAGAVAGALVVTVTNIPHATTGMGTGSFIVTACYNPANNSVIIGNQTNSLPSGITTGDLASFDLSSFTRNKLRVDDGLFYFSGYFNVPGSGNEWHDGSLSAFSNGVQGGVLAIEQDQNHTVQVGGVLALIDPTTFVPALTVNITSVINAAHAANPTLVPNGVPARAPREGGAAVPCQFGNMRYSTANGGSLLVTYDNNALGSPTWLITGGLTPPVAPPSSTQIIKGTYIELWQPNWINLPESVQDRPTDWDDGSNPGENFVQGVIIEADSFGQAKTFSAQASNDLSLHVPNELPARFNVQTKKAFSFSPPFLAHNMRLVSTDGVPWRVWGVQWICEPYPELAVQWSTEGMSHGLRGWQHVPWMNIAHISTADLTLTIVSDYLSPAPVTVPNSGGVHKKTLVIIPPNKGKVFSYALSSSAPFRLFERDCEVAVGEWGRSGAYTKLKPFGGPTAMGAKV